MHLDKVLHLLNFKITIRSLLHYCSHRYVVVYAILVRTMQKTHKTGKASKAPVIKHKKAAAAKPKTPSTETEVFMVAMFYFM